MGKRDVCLEIERKENRLQVTDGHAGIKETVDKLAIENGVYSWSGHVLRRNEDDLLRRMMRFKIESKAGNTKEVMEEACRGG